MQDQLNDGTTERPDRGGPYARACEKPWRVSEGLVLRQGRLEDVLNGLGEFPWKAGLPDISEVPKSCRGLLPSVIEEFESKWTSEEVGSGPALHEYSFDPFGYDEARGVAKAVVDLTDAVTLENTTVADSDRRL